jgi:hypothetical protein
MADAFDLEAEEKRIIREGVERSNQLFKLYQPRPHPLTPMEARQGDDDVIVWAMIPRAFKITLNAPAFDTVNMPAGIHEIPLSIATHFYSQLNKVEVHQTAEAAALAFQAARDLEEKRKLQQEANQRAALRNVG